MRPDAHIIQNRQIAQRRKGEFCVGGCDCVVIIGLELLIIAETLFFHPLQQIDHVRGVYMAAAETVVDETIGMDTEIRDITSSAQR